MNLNPLKVTPNIEKKKSRRQTLSKTTREMGRALRKLLENMKAEMDPRSLD